MSSQTLPSIHWQISEPPLAAREWFDWESEKSRSSTAEEQGLEKQLGIADGTIGFLRRAFEKNLSRHCGWQMSTKSPAMEQAAAIYKRGVAAQGGTKASAPRTLKGSYQIRICNDAWPREILDPLNACFAIIDSNVWGFWR